ncbi:GNAT family acetyltransferase [Streptococcus pyogenes]|uniref:GNAT family N-acetyltransferase n=1 Tax=Streptococcus pyogenes TaxID=1314 RepID=UPI0007C7270F|nr:GNAT family acetyltransferase [Streptococcus pyogenes]
MEIRRPTLKDKDAVLSMINEFLEQKSATDGLWHFNVNDFNYETWLEDSLRQEMGLSSQGVPAIQYVAFDERSQAIGFLNLRLRLNERLLEKGGHIGYSVRPSQHGKGYAKEMLKQAVSYAISKNITTILVTCDETNVASRAVIVANGGILEDSRGGTERYWIEEQRGDK